MNEQSWPLEPWSIDDRGHAEDANGRGFGRDNLAAMRRALLCTNHLAGLNPEAVPGLVKAAAELEAALFEYIEAPTNFTGVVMTRGKLRRALTAVKATEDDDGN